jgi:hypothetical protein
VPGELPEPRLPTPPRRPARRFHLEAVAAVAAFLALAAGVVVVTTSPALVRASAPDASVVALLPPPVTSTTMPPTSTATSAAPTTAAPTTSAPTTVPTTAPAPTVPPPPAPCAVSFVADSVGTGVLRNGLADELGAVLCPMVWHAAYGGLPIDVGAKLLARAGDEPSNVALVMLGFHNARSEVGQGRFPAWIDAVVGAAGGRIVVWPMLASTNDCSTVYKQALLQANAELLEAQQRWPNLVLADYPSFLAGHPEYAIGDCPHLNAPGYRAVAAWLAGEVRRLVEQRAPPGN